MSHAWITYYTMSDEEFKEAVAERKASEQAKGKAKTRNHFAARGPQPGRPTDD
jgi:hypothetical protein